MFCCSSAWTTWTQSDKRCYVNSSQRRTDIASAAAARRVWKQPPTVKMSDDDFRFTRGNAFASHTHTHTRSVMSCTSGTSSGVTARGAHHRSLREILLRWCCFVGLSVSVCVCVLHAEDEGEDAETRARKLNIFIEEAQQQLPLRHDQRPEPAVLL